MIKEIFGTFDGENMLAENGFTYNVPPNYASKSKLLEGDKLKLLILDNGEYKFKQIQPLPYINCVGQVVKINNEDTLGVIVNRQVFKILIASQTYFKLIPGLKISVRVPENPRTSWAVVDHVIDEEEN